MANKTTKNSTKEVVEGLKKLLGSSYALYVKTQNYHWNVEGIHFSSLHALFQEQYTELATAIDDIAERIRAIGEYAPGGLSVFAKLSEIKDASEKHVSEKDMLKDLLDGHEILVKLAEDVLEKAESTGDEVTVDLMVQRSTVHQKTAWMLRSHVS